MLERHGGHLARIVALLAILAAVPAIAVNNPAGPPAVIATKPAPGVAPPPDPATYSIAVKDVEEGERLAFLVFRTGASLPAQRLSWRASGDVEAVTGRQSGFVDFAPGRRRAIVSIPTVENASIDPDRSITLTLSGPVRFQSSSASGRVFDDDPTPTARAVYALSGAQAKEGERLNFRVARSGASLPEQSLSWRIAGDVAAVGGPRAGTLIFADGARQAFVSIPTIDNGAASPARLITLTLRGQEQIRPASAIGQILDDDTPTARARVFAGDTQAAEGQPMTFTLTRRGNTASVTRISYETGSNAGAGEAIPGADFEPRSGVVVFDVGETTRPVVIATHGRADVNGERRIHLFLISAPQNVEIGDGEGIGVISDADNLLTGPTDFAIENASANRGEPLIFTIRRTGPPTGAYSLAYMIAVDGTPVAIEGPTPRIPFAERQSTATLPVNYAPCSQSVTVTLSDPQPEAAITKPGATGTILGALPPNCEAKPASLAIKVETASAVEGGTLAFLVSRTGDLSAPQNIRYMVSDESSCAPQKPAAPRVATFEPGQQTLSIQIPLCDDSEAQGSRRLRVSLLAPTGTTVLKSAVATIEDDDRRWPWWIWLMAGLIAIGLAGLLLGSWSRIKAWLRTTKRPAAIEPDPDDPGQDSSPSSTGQRST